MWERSRERKRKGNIYSLAGWSQPKRTTFRNRQDCKAICPNLACGTQWHPKWLVLFSTGWYYCGLGAIVQVAVSTQILWLSLSDFLPSFQRGGHFCEVPTANNEPGFQSHYHTTSLSELCLRVWKPHRIQGR